MAGMFASFADVQRLDTDPGIIEHRAIVLDDGRHSWYSGYHHAEGFAGRVRYSAPDLAEWDGVAVDRLRIGNFCQFASGVAILLGGNHGHDTSLVSHYSFNFFPSARSAWAPVGDTVIGHEAWLGYESLVLGGVRIGVGAVIGARAVVSRDVAPFAVVVGANRVVGHRFDPLARRILWRVNWWTWPDERIAEALPLLQATDVAALGTFAGISPDVVADDPDPINLPATTRPGPPHG